ncbi:hypothetical protein PMAYCL1PPCAC_31737 [Pristionchus mayeri]|uniref:Uncharacterized protein n=1 Tax=Pristionchus mayeri TaxID=1317129 RepID=A0AAN5ICT9_9BILA|nr:hypothetical protein PMAYCL1PPCAC_31737 [Pristionchus mayeri]
MSSVMDKFTTRSATPSDAPAILESALSGFINACSHSKALNLTRADVHELIRWIMENSLHDHYSVVIHEKASGKLVGFRLYSVSHRDSSQDFNTFELDVASMNKNVKILCNCFLFHTSRTE